VHGTIESGETPVQASRRELEEETGLTPVAFYNLSRTEAFYQHTTDVLAVIPAFAAFVAPNSTPRLSVEHDRYEWLPPGEAGRRFAWPRERRALDDVLSMVGGGDAGLLDDVLRVS
jgi:8-oxo-dGTP pyrophosphatase MutT (NUDIX family)